MSHWIEDARQMVCEMPWTVAGVLLAVVFGAGMHGTIVYEAYSPELHVVANHASGGEVRRISLPGGKNADEMCGEKIPGVTVMVGIGDYDVELSVPMGGVRSMLLDAQMKLASTFGTCVQSTA